MSTKEELYEGGCYSLNNSGNFVYGSKHIYTDDCKSNVQPIAPETFVEISSNTKFSIDKLENMLGSQLQSDKTYIFFLRVKHSFIDSKGVNLSYQMSTPMKIQISFEKKINNWQINSLATHAADLENENLF